jgi:hypothetical protein
METPTYCADHCRRWLADSGLAYGPVGREAFARAHPWLFGRAYEVTLRGYERWLARGHLLDDLETFAAYLTGRFERALLAAGREFLVQEDLAHAVHVQQVVERALVCEHGVRWADEGWQAQHSGDAFAVARDSML